MSQTRVEGPKVGKFTVDAAVAPFLRLKHSGTAGVLSIAGDENWIGEADQRAYASGDPMTYYDKRAPGTHVYVANGAIEPEDEISTAAGGMVQSGTDGAITIGKAITRATAAGEQVEATVDDSFASFSGARSDLVQDDSVAFPIPLHAMRVWDAPQTNPVGTPANDDLGLVYNTFGTAAPTVETGDLKTAGSTTRRIGFQIPVPECYVAGQTAQMRLNAGMKTTVADVSATIDLEVTRAAAPTVDICATAAQDINSLVAADKTFNLTATDLVPGELLDCVVSIAVNDAASGTAVIGKWNQALSALLLDIKG